MQCIARPAPEEAITLEQYREFRIHGLTQHWARLAQQPTASDPPVRTARSTLRKVRRGVRTSGNRISCKRPKAPRTDSAGHYVINARGRAASVDGPAWRPLDWVVAGGEIGAGAQPMHPDWVRTLGDKCAAASIPFFFKRRGE
jgi:protein gp37